MLNFNVNTRYEKTSRILFVGSTFIALTGYLIAAAQSETSGIMEENNVEEVLVLGERFEIDTTIAFDRLTESNSRGAKLYKQGKYHEALPYLLVGARTGFKMSQARVGAIYLGGMGGVPQDIRKGIGWLGVASEPVTAPEIRRMWKRLITSVRSSNRDEVASIVDEYIKLYGRRATGTDCEMTSNTKSLVALLECTLDYEFCRFASDEQKALVGCFSGVAFLCEFIGMNHMAIVESAIGRGPLWSIHRRSSLVKGLLCSRSLLYANIFPRSKEALH